MRAHYLQHVPFEGLGSIESRLHSSGYEISSTQLFESPEFPALEEIDLLLVMGGPMSVNDEEIYPWLSQEKEFIRRTIDMGKPVLGVCLGAQLIANVLGARVYQNSEKEIGWWPVHGTPVPSSSLFQFPASIQAFHWHGETFNLPAGATLLASSTACKNQAFQIGTSVIGLQFHLETTPESAAAIVSHCRDELVPAQYVQSEEEILSAATKDYNSINDLMDAVLAFIQS